MPYDQHDWTSRDTITPDATAAEWLNEIEGQLAVNGGTADIGDLQDVTVTTPANGQVLTYSTSGSKWVNADIPAQFTANSGWSATNTSALKAVDGDEVTAATVAKTLANLVSALISAGILTA